MQYYPLCICNLSWSLTFYYFVIDFVSILLLFQDGNMDAVLARLTAAEALVAADAAATAARVAAVESRVAAQGAQSQQATEKLSKAVDELTAQLTGDEADAARTAQALVQEQLAIELDEVQGRVIALEEKSGGANSKNNANDEEEEDAVSKPASTPAVAPAVAADKKAGAKAATPQHGESEAKGGDDGNHGDKNDHSDAPTAPASPSAKPTDKQTDKQPSAAASPNNASDKSAGDNEVKNRASDTGAVAAHGH